MAKVSVDRDLIALKSIADVSANPRPLTQSQADPSVDVKAPFDIGLAMNHSPISFRTIF
jgi:hypothetical protein